ncbi:MAG: hypothetical protein IPM60_04295 [Rhodospirillales bacterium]|nr:hypothetical protein [Rhodospirillales bacterium]
MLPSANFGETGLEEIWLLGQPSLSGYLDYVRKIVIGGAALSRAKLADEWRLANDYYYELESREAGIADQAACADLDPALQPLADEVMADARFVHTFDTLPTRFGVVELEKLVVYQLHVTRQYVDGLTAKIGSDPDPEALFRFCMPLDAPTVPLKIQRVGSRRYDFISASSDLRYHESVFLRPDQLRDYTSFGPIAGVFGVVVGFGSNFLNVIQADNRFLLNNGYHRACALYAAGVRHVPCIIKTVTRKDELDLTACQDVRDDPAFYFKGRRPPLLKDFFDPRIRKVLPVPKLSRLIEVTFDVRDCEIAG